MRWTSKLAAAALAVLLQACATAPVSAPAPAPVASEVRAPVTILVSIDGFRPDYLDRGVTPVLSRLAAEGASGPMRPSFPSKTYPNHWTLVTGLRPDRHGITANKMEDPARPNQVFRMATDDPYWWNTAEPIWIDAERAGIRSGTMFWPGSNVAIGGTKDKPDDWQVHGGMRPSDWAQFNQAIDGGHRVEGILDWLRRPAAKRPKLMTLYFNDVDDAGHDFGPDAAETRAATARIDGWIGDLLAGLAELRQPANLVIVADHGMAAISPKRVVLLGDFVEAADYHFVETGPFASLTPTPGREAVVEKALLGRHPHFECWRKQDIPTRFHYGSNPRIPAIFCLADIGWQLLEKPPTPPFDYGTHGYDNFAPEMLALFIAHGPAFRRGRIAPFDNVDVYPLLRDLLGLPPKPGVDGDDAPFRQVLLR